jgi:formate-dependent nitrite reductase membrane component NrfD
VSSVGQFHIEDVCGMLLETTLSRPPQIASARANMAAMTAPWFSSASLAFSIIMLFFFLIVLHVFQMHTELQLHLLYLHFLRSIIYILEPSDQAVTSLKRSLNNQFNACM